jgi:Protein kinase domain
MPMDKESQVRETLADGRFVIVGSLGEGAQGHTFDGVDLREGRPVAIKRFDVRGAKTWKEAELAERETRVLQSLSHPRLPRYVGHFEEDGALYLVMEKIEGESLAAIQKRGGRLSEADVLRFLRDASEVLDYLHKRAPPVIHRDLKPGNVIRRPDGSFAFVDFGAVRDKLRPEGGSTVVGTFGYMAPEQFQGRALPASDVYAIGATALSLLTGRQPEDLPHKGLAIDVRAALGGGTDRALVDALVAMLDPDPDRRPGRIAPVLETMAGRARQSSRSSRPPEPRAVHNPGHSWHDTASDRLEAQAEEFEARAREHEARAAAGGPGARGWLHGAEAWRKAARKMRANADRHRVQRIRDAERRERRRARKDGRHAERIARHRARGADHRPPWPVALLMALMFAMGILAVAIATQVVVPTVFRFLALFFATRGLNSAARAVREAGEQAIEGMDRSRRWFLSGGSAFPGGENAQAGGYAEDDAAGKVRVDANVPEASGRKVRVGAAGDEASPLESESDDEDAADRARR